MLIGQHFAASKKQKEKSGPLLINYTRKIRCCFWKTFSTSRKAERRRGDELRRVRLFKNSRIMFGKSTETRGTNVSNKRGSAERKKKNGNEGTYPLYGKLSTKRKILQSPGGSFRIGRVRELIEKKKHRHQEQPTLVNQSGGGKEKP